MEKMEDELDESMILEGSDVDQEFDGDDEDANSRRNKRMLSGRGVTLNMLINDKILEPGNGHLTIDYLGAKFVGDLLPEGKIRWQESKEVFSSPSAWAIHCKKLLNPDRKPGCGWSSIKYRGKKLDHYKAAWFRKHKNNPALGLSPLVGMANMGNLVPQPMSFPTVPEQVPPTTSRSNNQRSKQDTGCRPGDRIIMNHALLGNRCIEHNANTQVLATPFSALDRIQPFTVTIATNCLLLMDFHCHLTKSEVVGYLGGTWDIASHNLAILQAFPCKSRLGDTESSTAVEEEIQQSLERRNLTLVGWYHSHPNSKRQPTIRDIDNQLEYQIIMKGDCDSSYTPCIGLICSPFSIEKGLEADYLAYWVMPPPEHRPNEYGKPMEMVYNVANDSFLTQDLLMEMRQLADYYRGAPDVTNFKSEFKGNERIHTFWEKIKASLTVKLPRDLQVTGGQPAAHLQAVNHFWEFVKGLILV